MHRKNHFEVGTGIKSNKGVKVLHCSFPRSGTYLLYSVLSTILEIDEDLTFCSKVGLSVLWKNLYEIFNLKELFPGYLKVDMIRLSKNGEILLTKLFPIRKLESVNVDWKTFLSISTIVWSHDLPCRLIPLTRYFTHCIYLVRDGRDTINSLIHFLARKDIQKISGKFKGRSLTSLYEDISLFVNLVKLWKRHIESYFQSKNQFILLRYEDIVRDKTLVSELLGILYENPNYLNSKFSFGKMKFKAPLHLRRGTIGNWKEFFSETHVKIFNELAGDTLLKLGYKL